MRTLIQASVFALAFLGSASFAVAQAAFGRWHLGEDDEEAEGSRRRYKFPYGDFRNVHRCAVLRAESRGGQYKYTDIELAAAHLREMLDTLMVGKRSTEQEHGSSI